MLYSFYSGAPGGGGVRFHFAFGRDAIESLRARLAGEGRRVTDFRAAMSGDPNVWELQAYARRHGNGFHTSEVDSGVV
jgi:hypothetical protein